MKSRAKFSRFYQKLFENNFIFVNPIRTCQIPSNRIKFNGSISIKHLSLTRGTRKKSLHGCIADNGGDIIPAVLNIPNARVCEFKSNR